MPNYIVSLAHFCELHGPLTIFCTQTSNSPTDAKDFELPLSLKLQTCASCKLQLPENAVNISLNDDEPSGRVFVSTQYPSHQLRYTALTKLAMKALSVETTSDMLKAMFFGDAVNGYCINKIFKIGDVHARGAERKYAVMVVGDSELHLLSHWDIISMYMTELIQIIQLLVVQKQEQAHYTRQGMSETADRTGMFENERYLRRSMVKPQSLVELTGDTRLFAKIHLWAIDILKNILRQDGGEEVEGNLT